MLTAEGQSKAQTSTWDSEKLCATSHLDLELDAVTSETSNVMWLPDLQTELVQFDTSNLNITNKSSTKPPIRILSPPLNRPQTLQYHQLCRLRQNETPLQNLVMIRLGNLIHTMMKIQPPRMPRAPWGLLCNSPDCRQQEGGLPTCFTRGELGPIQYIFVFTDYFKPIYK